MIRRYIRSVRFRPGRRGLGVALAVAVLAALGAAAWVEATPRPAAYVPVYGLREGEEVVMVFIGGSICRAHLQPGFAEAMERAKLAAARRAAGENKQFRVVGVAIDWKAEEGWDFLQRFGAFDEVSLGGNWLNHDVVRYVWRDMPGRPSIPQVVLLQRTVRKGTTALDVTEEREVRRIVGVEEIERWADAGAPFTGRIPPASTAAPRPAPQS